MPAWFVSLSGKGAFEFYGIIAGERRVVSRARVTIVSLTTGVTITRSHPVLPEQDSV